MVHYKINSTKFLRGGVPFGDKISHYQNTNTETYSEKKHLLGVTEPPPPHLEDMYAKNAMLSWC